MDRCSLWTKPAGKYFGSTNQNSSWNPIITVMTSSPRSFTSGGNHRVKKVELSRTVPLSERELCHVRAEIYQSMKRCDRAWSWSGNIPDKKDRASYRSLLLLDSANDNASIHLSDGQDSFVGSATLASLTSEKGTSLARIDEQKSFQTVRKVLETSSAAGKSCGFARVVKSGPGGDVSGGGYAVRLAAQWGEEFGVDDVYVDVASMGLRRREGNENFLDATFARLESSRKEIQAVEEEEKNVNVQVEDLSTAYQLLAQAQSAESKRKRMETLADELNEYKRKCMEAGEDGERRA